MANLFAKRDLNVIALSDRDALLAVLQGALDAAGPDSVERPGLERAVALVADVPVMSPAEMRGRWARERIEAAGVEVKADSLVAVKALRKAEPELSLLAAVNLTKDAAAVQPR
jgi:microcystin degradation protein MlrC